MTRCRSVVKAADKLKKRLVLDQTVFYPQSGGQQSDVGFLHGLSKLQVTAVKKDPSDGQVWHYVSGDVEEEKWLDAEVECEIDENVRMLNSRSHSAGHALDHAAEDLNLPVEVRGACHFLPYPYVEYEYADANQIPANKEAIEKLQKDLEEAANRIISANIEVTVYTGKVSELSEWRQALLPEPVLREGTVRLIKFCAPQYHPVPCSGTHVRNSSQIKPIKVRKISQPDKTRPGFIRVSYLLQ